MAEYTIHDHLKRKQIQKQKCPGDVHIMQMSVSHSAILFSTPHTTSIYIRFEIEIATR